jgi:hypothetical protein
MCYKNKENNNFYDNAVLKINNDPNSLFNEVIYNWKLYKPKSSWKRFSKNVELEQDPSLLLQNIHSNMTEEGDEGDKLTSYYKFEQIKTKKDKITQQNKFYLKNTFKPKKCICVNETLLKKTEDGYIREINLGSDKEDDCSKCLNYFTKSYFENKKNNN